MVNARTGGAFASSRSCGSDGRARYAIRLLRFDDQAKACVFRVAVKAIGSCQTELHNCLWDLRNSTLDAEDMDEAANGREAVEKAVKLKPDIVILDLSMPVMDGVEAAQKLHESCPDTRILILTTFGTSFDVARVPSVRELQAHS